MFQLIRHICLRLVLAAGVFAPAVIPAQIAGEQAGLTIDEASELKTAGMDEATNKAYSTLPERLLKLIDLKLSLSRETALLEEEVILRAEVKWPPTSLYFQGAEREEDVPADLPYDLAPPLVNPDGRIDSERGRATLEWLLYATETGDLEVAPPPLRFLDEEGRSYLVTHQQLGVSLPQLQAVSVLDQEEPAQAARASSFRWDRAAIPYTLLEWVTRLAPYLLGALLLVIIGYIVGQAKRKRAERALHIPPDRWAKDALHKLRNLPVSTQDEIEDWHVRLSAILRGYVARRWDVAAEEMTSPEVAAALIFATEPISDTDNQRLEQMLEQADNVKYARFPAAKAVCDERLEQAFRFVEDTAKQQITPEEPPAQNKLAKAA